MKCEACQLSKECGKLNAMPGWGNPEAKLVVMLDAPGDALAEKLLVWIFRKLSLTSEDVWVDYLSRCAIPKKPAKKLMKHAYDKCWTAFPRLAVTNCEALVVCGQWCNELLIGGKMKNQVGRKNEETGIWAAYSMKYLLMNPAECVVTWRVIFKAAEEAGLSPKMNMSEPMFDFPPKKLLS